MIERVQNLIHFETVFFLRMIAMIDAAKWQHKQNVTESRAFYFHHFYEWGEKQVIFVVGFHSEDTNPHMNEGFK